MDELKFKLSTNFMKNIVAKLISRAIYKKYGYKVKIQLNEIDIWSIDGDTTVKVNVEANLKSEEFNKLIKML
jgi:hypothetical protein